MERRELTSEEYEALRDFVLYWKDRYTFSHEFEFEGGLVCNLTYVDGCVDLLFSRDREQEVEVAGRAQIEHRLSQAVADAEERAEHTHRDILHTQAVLDMTYR